MPSQTLNGRGTLLITKAGKTNFSYTIRTESGSGGQKAGGLGGTDGFGNTSGGDGTSDGTGSDGSDGIALLDGGPEPNGPLTIPDGSELVLSGGGGHGAVAGGGGGQTGSFVNSTGGDVIGVLVVGNAEQNTTFTVGVQTLTIHHGGNASANTPGAGGSGSYGDVDGLSNSGGGDGNPGGLPTFGGGGQGANYCVGTVPDNFFTNSGSTKLRVLATEFGIEVACVVHDNDSSLGDVTVLQGSSGSGSIGGYFPDTPITEDAFASAVAHSGGAGENGDTSEGGHGGGPASASVNGTDFAGAAEDTSGTNGDGGGGEHSVAPGAFSPSVVTISYDLAPPSSSGGAAKYLSLFRGM